MMPQWDLLDFIAGQGRKYPTFDLRMSTEATGLTYDAADRVSGVTLANGDTLSARLVIAADGRRSVLRGAAELPLEDLGAPMDVLWFRIPVPAGMDLRSEEHTSELQSLMRISYDVFCLKNKT